METSPSEDAVDVVVVEDAVVAVTTYLRALMVLNAAITVGAAGDLVRGVEGQTKNLGQQHLFPPPNPENRMFCLWNKQMSHALLRTTVHSMIVTATWGASTKMWCLQQ